MINDIPNMTPKNQNHTCIKQYYNSLENKEYKDETYFGDPIIICKS